MEKLEIKHFQNVEVGDMAFSSNTNEYEGEVLAKGTFEELSHEYHATHDREKFKELEVNPDTVKCVAIKQDPTKSMERYPNLIFLYDYDPCSVYCKTKKL